MKEFNPNLDYFRGISILIVVLFHYSARLPAEALFANGGSIPQIFSFGWIGVYVFFIVSGYCIAGSFGRSKGVADFMAKRGARIYPPFVAASCLIYAYQLVAYVPSFQIGDWGFSPSPIPFTDFMMTTFLMARDLGFEWVDGAYWTLLIEMKFYLLFAILGAVGLMKRTGVITLTLVYAMPAIWAVCVIQGIDTAELVLRNVFLAPYFPFFILGINLAAPQRNDKLCISTAVITILILFLISIGKPSPVETPLWTVTIYAALLILLFAAIYHPQKFNGIISRIWGHTALRQMGIYSFSWYLIHQKLGISLVFMLSAYVAPALAVVLATAATFALSVVFSKLFEHRFRRPVQTVLSRLLTALIPPRVRS